MNTKIGLFLKRSLEWLPVILSLIAAFCIIALAVAFLLPALKGVAYYLVAVAFLMVVYIRALPFLVERHFKIVRASTLRKPCRRS